MNGHGYWNPSPHTSRLAGLRVQAVSWLVERGACARINAIRAELGPRLLILGHHYQQDEVIALSNLQGDSYQLSRMAADSRDCRFIAFCGVHFMAETADIVANRPDKLAERNGERVTVVLPDMAAGCSMADMAAIDQVESCWEELGEVIDTADITPVTYINSAASLKAFCGRHGGIVCTSSQRRRRFRMGISAHQARVVFPRSTPGPQHRQSDGHSARANGRVESARRALGGNAAASLEQAKVLLWQGHCSVHAMFRPEHVDAFRAKYPGHQNSGAPGMLDGSGRQERHQRQHEQDHSHRRASCRRARNGPSARNCIW